MRLRASPSGMDQIGAHESVLREFFGALTRAGEMRQIVDERVFVLVDKRGKFVVVHRVPYCYGRAKGDSVPETRIALPRSEPEGV